MNMVSRMKHDVEMKGVAWFGLLGLILWAIGALFAPERSE